MYVHIRVFILIGALSYIQAKCISWIQYHTIDIAKQDFPFLGVLPLLAPSGPPSDTKSFLSSSLPHTAVINPLSSHLFSSELVYTQCNRKY